jgi:type VI secretion system protein ImpL
MWLWILSALFIALVWAVWFILQPAGPELDAELFPTWAAVVVTVLVVLMLVGIVVYRRVRAARAARALEKAIAEQAQEQALNAKPERRAEIQELEKRVLEGIQALKTSKLGGGHRGAEALYSLPWYVMIGPPGAGKTTALRHSGLSFPYLDPAGGGVRGVGGTRNCDWWFTNEAILLDTAGRYTTASEDHDEWMAFLEMLLRFRSHKPINGVLVAVSVAELLDGTEDQVAQTARRVRERVDELQETLKMRVPVYVLFTKTDLVAGFVEFFGDLKKSERSQGIGATLKLSSDKKEPGKIFEAEFDGIIERIHQRGLRRLATERSKDAKEKIFQFPLELAAIKKPLADFMAAAFGPGPSEEATPILRGFYFTSGTQEGRPMERVLGAMGRAFGLKAAAIDESALPKTEPRSYFLHDVFTGVVFPDQDVAARTAGEIRKQRLQRLAIAFAALTVASVLLVPAIISFFNNRAVVEETRRISQEAADVKWDGKADPRPTTVKVDKLEKLRAQAELLDAFEEEGPPLSYTWAMYQGDRLLEPALNQYIRSLEQGFVLPTRTRLEQKLKSASGAKYIDDYNNLKAYLLLNDVLHMQDNADWETGRLTQVVGRGAAPRDRARGARFARADPAPREILRGPLAACTREGRAPRRRPGRSRARRPLAGRLDAALLRPVRHGAHRSEVRRGRAPTVDNLRYPPITLSELFADRPEALTKLKSRQKEREGKWFEVQGPYTDVGHEAVVAALAEGFELLEREKWVVPLTSEEKQQGDKIQQALNRVRQDYDSEYIRQWTGVLPRRRRGGAREQRRGDRGVPRPLDARLAVPPPPPRALGSHAVPEGRGGGSGQRRRRPHRSDPRQGSAPGEGEDPRRREGSD